LEWPAKVTRGNQQRSYLLPYWLMHAISCYV